MLPFEIEDDPDSLNDFVIGRVNQEVFFGSSLLLYNVQSDVNWYLIFRSCCFFYIASQLPENIRAFNAVKVPRKAVMRKKMKSRRYVYHVPM